MVRNKASGSISTLFAVFVISAVLTKNKLLLNARKMRWSIGAKELIFTNQLFNYFFSRGKVIPVIRGAGVYQDAVNFCVDRLNDGNWVHVFPQGKVTLDSVRLKWGVGRMVADCIKTPVILPFWHVGMDDFLPNTRPYVPRLKQKVTVVIGEPVNYLESLQECRSNYCSAVSYGNELFSQLYFHM